MDGSSGNDLILVDNLDDVVIEGSTGGTSDRVAASTANVLTASAYVEQLQTTSSTGTRAINLTGNAVAQSIFGNAGVNILSDGGGAGADTLTGAAGNDTYVVRNAGTQITEGTGGGTADRVSAGVSFVLGSGDQIEVFSTASSSGTTAINLTGNALIQSITGNAGANRIDGKAGSDTLTGLGGQDDFIFKTATGASNVDTVTDFQTGLDKIELDNAIFTGLVGGTLAASAFRVNATGQAADASDRVIYNSANGFLYFDSDGTGADGRVLFARLDSGLAMTNVDIFVV